MTSLKDQLSHILVGGQQFTWKYEDQAIAHSLTLTPTLTKTHYSTNFKVNPFPNLKTNLNPYLNSLTLEKI